MLLLRAIIIIINWLANYYGSRVGREPPGELRKGYFSTDNHKKEANCATQIPLNCVHLSSGNAVPPAPGPSHKILWQAFMLDFEIGSVLKLSGREVVDDRRPDNRGNRNFSAAY